MSPQRAPPWCQDDTGQQRQGCCPGRAREQDGEAFEPAEKARRKRRVGRDGRSTSVSHPIGRIDRLDRGNMRLPRQIESTMLSPVPCVLAIRHSERMSKPDPVLPRIAAQFTRHDVEKSGAAYLILDRRTETPIARLRPLPGTDRFELFYWSNVRQRWVTFGNLGRMKLLLLSAHEIVESDPMFRLQRHR